MNIITIEFTHSEAQSPKYSITDRIAVRSDCEQEAWATGKVAGLRLEEIFEPRWWYICKFDSPLGLTEECLDSDLVPESEIATLQAEWDAEVAASNTEPDVDDSLPEWANYYANESDYLLAEYPEAFNPDLAFD